jgi:hypothetical protein
MMATLAGGFAATVLVGGADTVRVVDGAVGALQPASVSIVRTSPSLNSTVCMSEQ